MGSDSIDFLGQPDVVVSENALHRRLVTNAME
jgi:hypothetical protein